MSATVDVPARLAQRVRRALSSASSGRSAVDEPGWRGERDRLSDLLEPVATGDVDAGELRRVIDLLSEADPSEESRMTRAEWNDEVTEVVAQLSSLT